MEKIIEDKNILSFFKIQNKRLKKLLKIKEILKEENTENEEEFEIIEDTLNIIEIYLFYVNNNLLMKEKIYNQNKYIIITKEEKEQEKHIDRYIEDFYQKVLIKE